VEISTCWELGLVNATSLGSKFSCFTLTPSNFPLLSDIYAQFAGLFSGSRFSSARLNHCNEFLNLFGAVFKNTAANLLMR